MTADTLVILPTYNEKDNLEAAVGGVREAGYDVLVVDDNSPDGTGRIADYLRRHLYRVPASERRRTHQPRRIGQLYRSGNAESPIRRVGGVRG